MAIITNFDGKPPKKIGNFLVYPLDDVFVVREKSGFDSDSLKSDPRYELCRSNAVEFGLLSKTCKAIRLLLADFLTKHNNLQVVNSLNKIARNLLEYDVTNPRGQRTLQNALSVIAAQDRIKNYYFTPDSKLECKGLGNSMEIKVPFSVPLNHANYLGMQKLFLFFDFETLTGRLETTPWQMEPLNEVITFIEPEENPNGYWISLHAFSFFYKNKETWKPTLAEKKCLLLTGFSE